MCLDRREWVNPARALACESGAEGLSKPCRTKQWLTGAHFWNGIRDSLYTWMSLDPTWGVAMVDYCGYDGCNQVSMLRRRAAQGPSDPSEIVLTPLCANLGKVQQGCMAVDAVDKGRLRNFIVKKVQAEARAICAAKMAMGQVPGPESQVPLPNFDVAKFKACMPTTEDHLAPRQDWIDAVEARLKDTLPEFQAELEKHNREYNPSGQPYRGQKRSADPLPETEEEAQAVELEEASITKEDLKDANEMDGLPGHVRHSLHTKDGHLYAWPLEDGIWSASRPVCFVWGNFLTQDEDAEAIAKNKSKGKQWVFKDGETEALFGGGDKIPEENRRTDTLSSLTAFINYAEDLLRASPRGFDSPLTRLYRKKKQKITTAPILCSTRLAIWLG